MDIPEPIEKCTGCGGKLADYDDYMAKQAVKRGVAALCLGGGNAWLPVLGALGLFCWRRFRLP